MLLTQGTLKATGAQATVYLDADNQRHAGSSSPAVRRTIEQLDDNGNLMQGNAATLDYDNVKQIAVLTGNASVNQQGRGERDGDKLTYNTQTSQMTGESNGDGLVHMTFQAQACRPAVPPRRRRATSSPTAAGTAL